MKAFTVNHLWHDTLSGQYKAEFYFQLSGQDPVIKERVFSAREFADRYLYACKLDWLKKCLEDYIHHKKHIIEAGKDADKKKALEVCLTFYNEVQAKGMGLQTICQRFLKGRAYFEAILPSHNNPSLQNSLSNLFEITNFCTQYCK